MHVNVWDGGPTLALADYWQEGNVLSDDPPGTQAFGYLFSDDSTGTVTARTYPDQYAMPLDKDRMIDSLLKADAVVAGDAALIELNVEQTAGGIPFVYSLMKIKQEPGGVQYNLTLHLHAEHVYQVQGFFIEGHTTGIRDAMVYEIARQNDWLDEPTADDPMGGWARDPFTGSRTGFVMNMSELPRFDEQFLAHPLSMARELLRSIAGS